MDKKIINVKFVFCILLTGLLFAPPVQSQIPWLTTPPEVGPGLEYQHRRIGDKPWSIHFVKISRLRPAFEFVTTLSDGTVYGLEPLTGQIKQLPAGSGKPLAGVNGDFFRIRPGPYQGDPTGLQILNGEIVSDSIGTCFWIDPRGGPHLGEVYSRFRAAGPGGLDFPFGLNRPRDDDKAVLYTPTMGPSTRTSGGLELVLESVGDGPWLPIQAGETYKAKVISLHKEGNSTIEAGRMILSIGAEMTKLVTSLKVGMTLSLTLKTVPDLIGVKVAIGGGPILLSGGKKRPGKPNPPRHPRTALGWNQQAYFLAVVDGRQEGLSIGMTLPELAAFMEKLGCTEAINLDGGGSSTLWLGGNVMNSPSDGMERHVANGLILVEKKPKEKPRTVTE